VLSISGAGRRLQQRVADGPHRHELIAGDRDTARDRETRSPSHGGRLVEQTCLTAAGGALNDQPGARLDADGGDELADRVKRGIVAAQPRSARHATGP
jgi:hypothetical protein